MHAKAFEPSGKRLVLRDHHAAVAIPAEILRGEEAERPDGRDFAGQAPLAIDRAPRADRLRGVLEHRNAGHRRHNFLDRRHLTKEVDRDDGLGP